MSYVKPNKDAFENNAPHSSMMVGQYAHIFERVEYPESGGMFAYFQGMPFPRKHMPFPEASWANDVAKRITMFFINSFTKKAFALPILAFGILPWKVKIKAFESILAQWVRVCDYILHQYYLRASILAPVCIELRFLIENSLIDIGISIPVAESTAKIIVTLIQYDDAYRYRVEDIFSCLTKEEIVRSPRKALKKAVKIFCEREQMPSVADKARAFGLIGSILLMNPKIKKVIKRTIDNFCDYENLCMDEADRYHTLIWDGYKFQGLTLDERVEIYKTKYHPNESYPPVCKIVAK